MDDLKKARRAAIKALSEAYDDDCLAVALRAQTRRTLKAAADLVLAANERLESIKCNANLKT